MANSEKTKLSITYEEWYNFIKIKKIKLLKHIDNTSFLDNSTENIKFITILNTIFNMDIFNISRISYLGFSFLDIYINTDLINILETNYQLQPITYNNTSKTIIHFIINLIINIEFILNLHLFIIIYINQQTNYFKQSNSILDEYEFSKPKILYKLEKICNDIKLIIKPSTTILLLLKINNKLCNIIDLFDMSLIPKESNLIKQSQEINYKITYLLDKFILAIAKNNIYQNINQSRDKDIIKDIYELSINYILDLANILYMYFDICFEFFIKYLKKEYDNDLDTKIKFDNIKKSISELLKNELTILETRFFEN
jgi:hypothetical protein